MAGVILVILVMLVLGPIGLFAGGAAWSALLGASLDTYKKTESVEPAESSRSPGLAPQRDWPNR